jgi:hypothetical protein
MVRPLRNTYQGYQYGSGLSIGSSMVSSAIWEKHARVSFSKNIKITRVRRTSGISSIWKTHVFSNCTRNYTLTY